MLRSRPYSGSDDLGRMHAVQAARWRRSGPHVATTPGDLTWWLHQHPPADATPKRIQVFERRGALVAWAVLWLPQTLTYGGDEHDAVLDWFEAEAAGAGAERLDVAVLDSDSETTAALAARGYAASVEDGFLHHMTVDPAGLDEPRVADGYRLAHVTDDLLASRVEAHRSAFHPSRVTVESYRTVRATAPYRPVLDVVAVTPDGTVAAYALAWLDEANGVAELEPVGTHAAHRRRGLARAACTEALRRARSLGATLGLVYSVDGQGSTALYESVGFRAIARHVEYRRALA